MFDSLLDLNFITAYFILNVNIFHFSLRELLSSKTRELLTDHEINFDVRHLHQSL